MKNLIDLFESESQSAFAFLEEEFGFENRGTTKDNYGCFIVYQNQTTAVRISFEHYDGGFFVTLYKLRNGQIPEYPMFFNPDAEFMVFDMNDLLRLRGQDIVKQNSEDLRSARALQRIVSSFAKQLKEHANDILCGDFTVLPRIKEAVRLRAEGH